MKKLLIVMLIALLGCISGSAAALADTEAPHVEVWDTSDGIVFSAWDNVDVTRVEVYDGDTYLCQAALGSWGCDQAWIPDFSGVALVGNISLVAKAYDAAGNVGTSVPYIWSVPTVVTATSPTHGTVTGVVYNFTATTRDPVIKADLFIDGVFKASSDYPVGTTSVSINYNWDTDQYNTNGYHDIEFKCYTQKDNVLSVGSTDVYVRFVTLTNPVNGSYVSGTLTNFTGVFTYPVGRADLYLDGIKYASAENLNGTNVSFAYNWDTTQYADDTPHSIEIKGYTVDSNKEISGTFWVYTYNSTGGGDGG